MSFKRVMDCKTGEDKRHPHSDVLKNLGNSGLDLN